MRRLAVSILAAAALLAGVAVSPADSAVASPTGAPFSFCPGPEPLIDGSTAWGHHRLAPGVSLAETTVHDAHGQLDVRVVSADLGRRNVAVVGLHRALASRHPLTTMAKRRHLVAAANGMYFDFAYGAPVAPFISHRQPLVLSATRESAAGIGVDDRAENGDVWLQGQVRSATGVQPLVAVNEVASPMGLSVYTAAWGQRRVPLRYGSRTRAIRNGHVLASWKHPRVVPRHGRLLVANGAAALHWLRSLPRPSHISMSLRVETDASMPFREAYGVGTEVVATTGEVQDDLYCRRGEIRAARTTIAWRDNGRQLMLVTVESRHGSENHGLDENQMSQILVSLGASRAFALDGGGSTELVARLPGHKRLSIPTLNPSGGQRPIPIGIGIYSR